MKERFTIEQAVKGVEVYLTFSVTSALDGGGWSTPCPGRFTPPGKRAGAHCAGGLVGHSPLWTAAKNLPTPGFDPRAVQPIL